MAIESTKKYRPPSSAPSTLALLGVVSAATSTLTLAINNYAGTAVLILASWLFDAIDGTLAKAMGADGRRQAVVDVFADSASYIFIFAGILQIPNWASLPLLLTAAVFVLCESSLEEFCKVTGKNPLEISVGSRPVMAAGIYFRTPALMLAGLAIVYGTGSVYLVGKLIRELKGRSNHTSVQS